MTMQKVEFLMLFLIFLSLQCPYCHRNESIEDAADSPQFCLEETREGGYQLKRSHAYYFQVCMHLSFLMHVHDTFGTCVHACVAFMYDIHLYVGAVSIVLHQEDIL